MSYETARSGTVGLLCIAIMVAGCAKAHTISRRELLKLDGFEPGVKVTLTDIHGEAFDFTSRQLLEMKGRVTWSPERYPWIEIDDKHFVGTTGDGEIVTFELADIDQVVVLPERMSDEDKRHQGTMVLGGMAIGLVVVGVVVLTVATGGYFLLLFLV